MLAKERVLEEERANTADLVLIVRYCFEVLPELLSLSLSL